MPAPDRFELFWASAYRPSILSDAAGRVLNAYPEEEPIQDPKIPPHLRSTQPFSRSLIPYLQASRTLMPHSAKVPEYTGFIHLPIERLYERSRLFGIELEVLSKNLSDHTLAVYRSLPGLAIIKSDSSLDSGGMEIVSAPATLAAHRQLWTNFFFNSWDPSHWRALLKFPKEYKSLGIAKKLESYTTGCCGMHIHVSAKSMEIGTVHKLWNFINAAPLDPFLSRIAGRKINGLNNNRVAYCPQHPTFRFRAAVEKGTDHFSALNLSASSETIEFRLFKGNTSPLGFMKNLDFVDAAIAFCEFTSFREIKGDKFLQFVIKNPARWPFFTTWLGSRLRNSTYRYLMTHCGPRQGKLKL